MSGRDDEFVCPPARVSYERHRPTSYSLLSGSIWSYWRSWASGARLSHYGDKRGKRVKNTLLYCIILPDERVAGRPAQSVHTYIH